MRGRDQGAEIVLLSFAFLEDLLLSFMDVETSGHSCFRLPNPGVRPD